MRIKITKKIIAVFTIIFSMSSFLNFQIPYSQAAMVIPDPITVNITGNVKDVATTNPVIGATVKLLLREPISYYQWYDYENNIWVNYCVESLVQKDNWCYTELQTDMTDNNGNYLLENTNACNLSFDHDYYFDLEFSQDNYNTKTIEDIEGICGQTITQNTLLVPNDSIPDWRRDIQAGDILYDPYASGVGHTGLYIGDGSVIEAQGVPPLKEGYPGKVNKNSITKWDYPERKDAYILRVKKPDGLSDEAMELIRNNAVEFVKEQLDKPYDWKWYQKSSDPDSPSWYCSELVWAAYVNQEIDLEYSHDPIGIISPVSPNEIFIDNDVYVIASHVETQVGGFKDYVFLLIFSPVEITVTDEDGNVFDKNNIGAIPGALYLEDEVDENGQVRDRVILPKGNYKITVMPKAGADPNETYSLVLETDGQQTYLAQDVKIADIPAEPYIIDESEATAGGFFDIEESSNNLYQAGTLDAIFSAAGNFFASTTPSQISASTAIVSNNGTLDFQYKISAENFSGDNDLCAALNLQVSRNGAEIYNAALTNFYVATSTLAAAASDNFDFIASLPSSAGDSLQNKTCSFDLKLKSWQIGTDDENSGFNDEEILSFNITSGEWALTPPAPFVPGLGDVVINEIMWMGSSGDPDDEWLELKNITNHDINISGWQLTNLVGGSNTETLMITIPNGKIISTNDFFLISNYSEESSTINVNPDLVDNDVVLRNTGGLQIKLYKGDWNNSANLIDTADDGSGAPLKGSNGSPKKSMERNDIPGDGTLTTNWHTCEDISSTSLYWDTGRTEQGTPGAANLSQNDPTAFDFDPNYQAEITEKTEITDTPPVIEELTIAETIPPVIDAPAPTEAILPEENNNENLNNDNQTATEEIILTEAPAIEIVAPAPELAPEGNSEE